MEVDEVKGTHLSTEKESENSKSEKPQRQGGRKKGTPNKKTLDLVSKLQQADFCPVRQLLTIIEREEGYRAEFLTLNSRRDGERRKAISKLMMGTGEYSNLVLRMFDYIYPKRKSVEFKQETSGKIEFITQDEFNEAKD
mgnify:CR=1 FL=1